VPQGIVGCAGGKRLMARYHVDLPGEKPVEGITIQMLGSGHARIMRPGSDKTPWHKSPILC